MFLFGKIDKNGLLWILRENFKDPVSKYTETQFKPAGCPFRRENQCGDWCPMFGNVDEDKSEFRFGERFHLEICKKTLGFDLMLDERPKQSSPPDEK